MRRSLLTIFSGESDILSHVMRLAVTEKGIAYDVEIVGADSEDPNIPKGTIVEGDLAINNVFVALEYLDDRFPHPSLMPLEPDQRARFRLLLRGIESQALPHMLKLSSRDPLEVSQAADGLIQFLLDVADIFDTRTTYICGVEFSVLDCFFAPIIYRLVRVAQESKYRLPEVLAKYYHRIHGRDTFRRSLTLRSSRGYLHDLVK